MIYTQHMYYNYLHVMTLKAGFHVAANCLRISCKYYRGLNRDIQNYMETYLASIATTVPEKPQQLELVQL